MRTFHVGGVAGTSFKHPIVKVKPGGTVHYNDVRAVASTDGNYVVLTKNGTVSVHDESGLELEGHKLVVGAVI